METAMTVFYLIIAVGLIVVILLQSGNEAGLSGAITGGSQAPWGKKKSKEELLGKVTVYFAVGFMIFSIIITILNT